ncbi:hypothetical protein L1887_50644 [Cichorium endivia]|nr:hypothetical protein L1887_50644 [Cichorium endivia]
MQTLLQRAAVERTERQHAAQAILPENWEAKKDLRVLEPCLDSCAAAAVWVGARRVGKRKCRLLPTEAPRHRLPPRWAPAATRAQAPNQRKTVDACMLPKSGDSGR